MIDIAKVNSYILFNNWRDQHPNTDILKRPKRFGQLEFTEELIRQLGNIFIRAEPPIHKAPVTYVNHPIIPGVSDLRRNCKLCFKKIQQK